MKYLKRYIHPQWGSVVGSIEEVRLAVLKDEVMNWYYRMEEAREDIPNLKYIKNTLLSRIEELEKYG